MIKIESLEIEGIRGIKERLTLAPAQKSILLFGENGTGKSSITDAIEWFYKNRIAHLSGEEIGRSGLEALRNVFISKEESGRINISFSDSAIDSEKTIVYKNESLSSQHSNNSRELGKYLVASAKENLYLRYSDLVGFILATKKEKLDNLSQIIGFSEITQKRDVLRKITGELSRELKNGDFDNRIGRKQAKIREQLGCVVNSETQFVMAVNELLTPLDIGRTASDFADIETILKIIQTPEDSKTQALYRFYNRLSETTEQFPPILKKIEDDYKSYHEQYGKILGDIEKLNKILLERMLTEGIKILKGSVVKDDYCPLCLQPKNREQLLIELGTRVEELKTAQQEMDRLNELKVSLKKELVEAIRKISDSISDKLADLEDNKDLKSTMEIIKGGLESYVSETGIEITKAAKELKDPQVLTIDRTKLAFIIEFCSKKIDEIKKVQEANPRADISSKILLAQDEYSEILELRKKKDVLQQQQKSMEDIYSHFLKMQKNALETFLALFSNDINDFYRFMNPGEKVEDLILVPLEKGGELQGITLEFKFYNTLESPPQKYLSESHLNCLGIALFLSSVKAFNKRNKFFILDDVISSFDTAHRKRFADLLLEKFAGFQVILFTHEKNWFDLVKNMVKGKGWQVKSLKWHTQKGTYLAQPAQDLKIRIEEKIRDGEVIGLGNDIRKYLENIVTTIAVQMDVLLPFRLNDKNEDRSLNDLLNSLRSRVKSNKKISMALITQQIERLSGSIFIGNKESHDSLFNASLGDLQAFWQDVNDFELFFHCASCGAYFKSKNFDSTNQMIKCGCGYEKKVEDKNP